MNHRCARIESLEDRRHFTATLTQLAYFKNNFLPGGLVQDIKGNLFGTSYNGGPSNDGQIFRVSPKTHTLWTVATFNGKNGSAPYASMVIDRKGDLFGTTLFGGSHNAGTVFELPAGSHKIKTLACFDFVGGGPDSPLIIDASGNLFGTTTGGGPTNDGTVFEIYAHQHKLATLATFDNDDGSCPNGLVADAAGNLYGTTYFGGAIGFGTVFKVEAKTHRLSMLMSLDTQSGTNPDDSLIIDKAGVLYGTTSSQGPGGAGTIFKLDPHTANYSILASFDDTNGASPFGGLVVDAAGNLFGTTAGGSDNDVNGSVFKLSAETHQITTVMSLNGTNGATPYATLVADVDGNLYGTAMVNNVDHGEVFAVTDSGFVTPTHK